ncbi:MAG: hypothetical protein ACOC44_11605, partial [Promethearchaeia archaeon]
SNINNPMSKTENLNVMGHAFHETIYSNRDLRIHYHHYYLSIMRLPFPSTGFFKSEIYPISGSLTAFHIANMR